MIIKSLKNVKFPRI